MEALIQPTQNFVSLNVQITKILNSKEVILDLSTFPELEKILAKNLEIKDEHNKDIIVYCIPDTIQKILLKAKENHEYSKYLEKLFKKWTNKWIDIQYLNKIFIENKELPQHIKLIHFEDVDKKTYDYCNEKIKIKGLIIELSPKFNLIGDIVGKILGYARKVNAPIIAFNQKLLKIAKTIPQLITNLIKNKKEFLSKHIPYLQEISRAHTVVSIIIETSGFFTDIPYASQVDLILYVFDP
jgi:hypothetical protein